nr:unnamed protein product [Callosobruchus analis]
MTVILTQHQKLVQVQQDLQSATFRYAGYGDFNPAKLMTEAKRFCSKFSVMLFCLYAGIAVLSFVTTMAHLEYDNHEEMIKEGKTCYDYLPFIYYIPFNETTKTGCKYATVWLTYNIQVFVFFICCHDALYFSLIYCLKTQFLVLCGAIRTIRERVLLRMNIRPSFTVLHDEDFPELEKEIYKEMQFINDHFGLLIRITAELERIFTFQTFFQTLVTLIMMASCLFVMSSVKVNSVMFYTQAEYCCCILTSATIFYWSGTGVITASDDISQALYDANWLSASRRFKTAILITMARIQTPLYLTIGKFVPMTLSVSVAVIL